ncbi:MAG: PEP-CTERM sorting domain-containing protein [Pseudomonadota bacterium]
MLSVLEMAWRQSRALALTALVLLGLAAPAAAVTVSYNGDFEQIDIGDGKRFSLLAPSSVPGWQTTDQAIELWANGFNGVTSYSGDQHAELNAYTFGTLFQTITGVGAGGAIELSFAHRARQGTDVMRVLLTDLGDDGEYGTADDTDLFDRQFSATTAAWQVNQSSDFGSISALGGDLRLSFTAVSTGSGSPSVGNFIDDVTVDVSPVPLPAAGLLLLGALAGLGFARRACRA